jgi:ArsR family transcriptional regulator, arsenate/arsenite/antimonite-responsive transcriptional repressor
LLQGENGGAVRVARGLLMHQDFFMRSLAVVQCKTPLAGSSLDDGEAAALERLLRSIADRHRLRILNMLVRADGSPICVCEFTAALDLPQPNVSYHLRKLVEGGLVVRESRGRYSYYALVDGGLANVAALVAA